jgi:hypothetical protein
MAMIEVEVQYRLMSPGGYLYAHIVAIGGNNPGWLIPLRDAIDNIENERCRYYVQGHLPFSLVGYAFYVECYCLIRYGIALHLVDIPGWE